MALVDLPAELLVLIFEGLGGRELRRGKGVGASRLSICRKWYAVAQEVYLSGLDLAKVKVRGRTIKTLDTILGYKTARPLMHKNTRNLHIRLHGHWWDLRNIRDADEYHDPDGASENYENGENEPPLEFDPQLYRTDAGSIAIKKWQDEELNPALASFFGDLGQFTALETVRFDVVREPEIEIGPQWDYLHSSVLASFIRHLPIAHDLKHLTLDTSGSALIAGDTEFHACTSLANTLVSIEHVRIRLATVCPKLFVFESSIPTSQIRLKCFVIKLCQPMYPTSSHMMANECSHEETLWRRLNLHSIMIKAAQNYARRVAALKEDSKLDLLRISYVHPRTPLVQTVDCLTMRRLYYCQQDNFSYEDDGSPRWMEDSEFMREGEAFPTA